jgi:hypothetical protein
MKQQSGLPAIATCRTHGKQKLGPQINRIRLLTLPATELKQDTFNIRRTDMPAGAKYIGRGSKWGNLRSCGLRVSFGLSQHILATPHDDIELQLIILYTISSGCICTSTDSQRTRFARPARAAATRQVGSFDSRTWAFPKDAFSRER